MTEESFSSKLSGFDSSTNSDSDTLEDDNTNSSSEVATTEPADVEHSGSEVAEAPVVVNTAYVAPDEKPEDEFDVNRDTGEGERREVTMGFMSQAHLDPARQADPTGVYYDDQQRRNAEVVRAQGEGREPDLENPPPTVGDPMIPVHVAERHNYQGAVVHSELDAPVVVGDYERDEYGFAITDDDGEVAEEDK